MPVITVSQLNAYIKNKIDSDTNLKSIWIKGEISNFKLHYSGHMYMTLKDDASAVKTVMFKSSAAHLKFMPQGGMRVIVYGRVSVYDRDGVYQLYAENIIPDGKGELYAAYEQLKEKLEKSGIFDVSHKKPLPYAPNKIGVVTSPTGAAIRDIINVITRRWHVAEIKIYPALVQGAQAPSSIVDGIKALDGNVDVIIAGRGGGSIEDLWAFNSEDVAMAVYNCTTPVISAVGHETDFTIIDFVSDLRAPTPSAAAEIAVPDIFEVKRDLNIKKARIKSSLLNLTEIKRKQLSLYSRENIANVFKTYKKTLNNNFSMLFDDFADAYSIQLKNKMQKLDVLYTSLTALGPLNVLKRGYSITSLNGKTVKSAKDLKINDDITVKLNDGSVRARVTQSLN